MRVHLAREHQPDLGALDRLLQRPDVWRGQMWQQTHVGYSTGFTELDAELADNGWPQSGICELFYDNVGQGELSLLFPLLRQILPAKRHEKHMAVPTDTMVVFIAPPHIPYAPALQQQGIDVEKILWVDTQDRKEKLWAFEQALSSGACPLVLIWLDKLSTTEARRLQLASEKGQGLGFVCLPLSQQSESHPVPLKMAITQNRLASPPVKPKLVELNPAVQAYRTQHERHALRLRQSQTDSVLTHALLTLTLLKRRGGWPEKQLQLPVMTSQLRANLDVCAAVSHQQLFNSLQGAQTWNKPSMAMERVDNNVDNNVVTSTLVQGPWSS